MGSLFKSTKAPAPFDVNRVASDANAQNKSNAFTNAAFNRVNQRDQFGNQLTYGQTGTDGQGNPIFQATQQLGDTGQMFASGLAGLGQRYFDTAGSRPDLGSGATFDRAYEFASGNLEPRFARSRDAEINRLRNQGLDPTSDAYRASMGDIDLAQNEARNNLVTNIQGQLFNQGLQDRQQSLAELAPGLQFGQQTLQPNLVNVPGVGVQNVDVAGLNQANQADLWRTYEGKEKGRQAMLGGLASIAGSLVAAPFTGGMSLAALPGAMSKMSGGSNLGSTSGLGGSAAMNNWGNIGQSTVGPNGMPTLGGWF